MIDELFVVLGAGASFDCAGEMFMKEAGWRPPLVRQLFDHRFQGILSSYPFAQAAAADIVPLLGDGTFQIEHHIASAYRSGTHEIARRKYLALPLYLQEVLYECRNRFAHSPDAYDRLVTGLSDVPHVTFVTLNYDTLLDDRLDALRPRREMSWYVDAMPQWSLIKLHGSVDWGYRYHSHPGESPSSPAVDLADRLSSQIDLRHGPYGPLDLREIRSGRGMVYYPALSVPVGASDELVCPPEHVRRLEQRLERAQPVHLLVIGYSGLDQEVIQILRRNDIRVGSLTVVDAGDAADRAINRIADGLRVTSRDLQFIDLYRDGFYDFTLRGLSEYVAQLASRAI